MARPAPTSSRVARGLETILAFWPSAVIAAGATALAILNLTHADRTVPVPFHPRRWVLALIIGLAVLAAEIAGVRRQKRLGTLERELERTEDGLSHARNALEGLAKIELAHIAEDFDYQSSERISLFGSVDHGFELLARYSANPNFNLAGRRPYRDDCGCLGRAWENNRAHLVVDVTRDQDPEGWAEQHRNTGLPADIVENLRMPVRTVIAVRVNDPRQARVPLGVVVLESSQTADASLVPGSRAPRLDPEPAANALATYMPRLSGILSVLCDLEDRRG
jgi:hypothetical protein